MQKSLQNAPANIVQSFYDAFVEKNAERRAKSGIKTVIIRRELGRCCDWCHKLAGIYDYSDAPEDIFRRHDNCRCMVTVRTEKGVYQDIWSRKEYNSQREARLARNEEIASGNTADDVNKALRKAKSNRERYADITTAVLKNAKGKGEISEASFFLHKGERYWVNKHTVKLDHSLEEKKIAEMLAEKLGAHVVLLPRVIDPQRIRCADFAIDGVKYELKTPKPSSNPNKSIQRALESAKDQANNVIVDIRNMQLPTSEIINQVDKAYRSKIVSFVDRLILVNGEELFKIYARVV